MEELKLRKIFILALHNKGSGVIVDMTWATIYNITPQ